MKNMMSVFFCLCICCAGAFAQPPNATTFKKTQINCKILSNKIAPDAELFGKQIQRILIETKPSSAERSYLMKDFLSKTKDYLNNYKTSWREERQSTDVDRVNFALDMEVVTGTAVNLAMEFPGESAEWYQIKLFDACTR